MPKVLAIIDVGPEGHVVWLSDNTFSTVPHGHVSPFVGMEVGAEPASIAPSVEQLQSPAQVAANVLSEIVQPHEMEE